MNVHLAKPDVRRIFPPGAFQRRFFDGKPMAVRLYKAYNVTREPAFHFEESEAVFLPFFKGLLPREVDEYRQEFVGNKKLKVPVTL